MVYNFKLDSINTQRLTGNMLNLHALYAVLSDGFSAEDLLFIENRYNPSWVSANHIDAGKPIHVM